VRRSLALLLLVAAAALAAGCHTVVTVDVDAATDGSGTVDVTATLDPQAAAALGGAERLALDDLAKAGWTVDPPVAGKDGGLTFSAHRHYRDGADLAAVLDEVGGKGGVFTATSAAASHAFGRTSHEAGTTVKVSGDPAQFSDAALAQTLGGPPLGWTPEELAAAGASTPGAGELVVRVDVPGSDGPTERRFDLTNGKAQEATVAAESTVVAPLPLGLAAAAAVAVVVGLVLLVVGLRRRRQERHS